MYLNHPSFRRGGERLQNLAKVLLIAGALTAVLGWRSPTATAQLQVPAQGFGRVQVEAEEVASGVYLPTDRTLSRAIVRARERLSNGEFHESLTFLQGVLAREEDSFVEAGSESREQQGLKATARRLIGELPREGLDAYELLYGAVARRQLDAALQSGDVGEVAKVVRQYFHTSAGYEAALVLAQLEADQGHRLAAAQWYQELLRAPRAVERFEPQLSVLAGLNYLAAGNREAASATLRSLFQNRPGSEVKIAGRTVGTTEGDVVAWLTKLVGEPAETTWRDAQWLMARGNASRNVEVPGGRPHLRPRWQARVVNDPSLEGYLTGRAQEYVHRGLAAIPSARPIATGDVVIMRTPTNVVAIDWKTGKRIWETREDDEFSFSTERSPRELVGGIDAEQAAAAGKPLEERVWEDALAMSLASDGRRVFVIRGESIPVEDQVMAFAMAPPFGRATAETPASTNQLVAYDLATQGKLLWEVDGSRAAAPLEGAFFLGPPLALDGTLFVLAEIRSAIYLFALDPAAGSVRWQQQLLGLELGVGMEPLRRRSGATPSYAGGILVCPTGAGAVVAIDLVKREFAWVYRYPRETQSAFEARNFWHQAPQGPPARSNDRWLDGSVVIASDRVLLTPPESGELHCLDLQTGKLLWKQPRGEGLFLGAVDHDHVLVIGAETIRAVRLMDGTAAWSHEAVPLPPGTLAAGYGYLSEDLYYLPLTSGDILAIHTTSGETLGVPVVEQGISLGNLIFYRGSIVSQSALMLDKFEQFEVLQERARAALAGNPDDVTALVELAELKRAGGDSPEAIKLLKRAFELAPDDPLVREMLSVVLLEGIATDYAAYREDIPLAARLIRDRGQQIELLRIEAAGLEKLGQRELAWDAYLRLADFTAEEPVTLRINESYWVRSDRWICGRLGVLWDQATAEERKKLAEKLAVRRAQLAKPRTAAELRHYLAHFDGLPGAEQVRLELARFLMERDRFAEAELELLQLSATAAADKQAAIAALVARFLDEASVVAEHSPWPRGQVDVELLPATGQVADRGAAQNRERQVGLRLLRIEQDIGLSTTNTQWLIGLDSSELVGRNGSGGDVLRLSFDQNRWPTPYRDSNLAYAARVGHLLYVAVGGQIVAVDGRQQGVAFEPLWQTDSWIRTDQPQGRRGGGTRALAVASRRPIYHPWSPRKRISGAMVPGGISLGPATPRGVVYQDQNELRCVDPLSGELLWKRTNIPPGSELFGDRELIFAADANERIAQVVRMIDGELVATRELPQNEWLVTAGRNVAELGFRTTRQNRVLTLRIHDVWSQDVLHESDYSFASRATVVEPYSIAIYEPSGHFQLIDARTGRIVFDKQLEPVPDVHSIHTVLSGDELVLLLTSPVQQKQFSPIGQPDYPLINGLVYGLSLARGEMLWPGPATVRHRGIVLSQPTEIPFLVFAEQKMTRDAAAGGGARLRVLCLDKRTGQTVYRNENLPATSAGRFRIRADRTASTVVLETATGKIQLTVTDRPRPPQPPTNDDLESAREISERGLRGIGERLSGALREALEGRPPEPPRQPVPAAVPNQNNIPPEQGDDD